MIFRSTYNKPVLLVGNGARAAGASELIYEFAEKTNIPVLTTMVGVDLAQDNIRIGFIGTHGNRIANMILNECDLIISVGARLSLRQIGRYAEQFAPCADLIRVDIDQYELSRDIKPNEQKYQIDAKEFMKNLFDEDLPNYSSWQSQCMKAKAILDQYDRTDGNFAIEKISSLLPESPSVSVDVGQHQCWSAQSLHLRGRKGRIHISGGYGTMGCGLPYAIGSSIAKGKTISYCITGDGGLQMNIQELQTIKRENLPIKIFVLNNRVLGKIYETQRANHDKRFALTSEEGGYTTPNFQKISEAYGIRAVTLNSYDELDQYSSWIVDKAPTLFNITLPEDSYLIPKIKWETNLISPPIAEDIIRNVQQILRA